MKTTSLLLSKFASAALGPVLLLGIASTGPACGGQGDKDANLPGHSSQGQGATDLDAELGQDGQLLSDPAAGQTDVPAATSAPFVFVVKNTHTEELVFNMDRGWGGSVLAYSGVPPNATSIIPFAKHCSAACGTSMPDLCPVCEEPEHLKDIRAAQKLERLAPGASLEIPWDGMVHVYEKVAEQRGCECFQTAPVAPAEYTVNICGLRLTSTAKESSKLQCVPGKVTVPASGPQRVEFVFAAP